MAKGLSGWLLVWIKNVEKHCESSKYPHAERYFPVPDGQGLKDRIGEQSGGHSHADVVSEDDQHNGEKGRHEFRILGP